MEIKQKYKRASVLLVLLFVRSLLISDFEIY